MTRPIQIKNEGAVRVVREAAALTRQSITEVVEEGARLVLERARRRATLGDRRRKIDQLLAEIDALPSIGPPLTDDDLYDDYGLPK